MHIEQQRYIGNVNLVTYYYWYFVNTYLVAYYFNNFVNAHVVAYYYWYFVNAYSVPFSCILLMVLCECIFRIITGEKNI